MKKFVSAVLCAAMMLGLSVNAFALRPVKVVVGGKTLYESEHEYITAGIDVPVHTENSGGRVLLPLRTVFEEIGARVGYDGAGNEIRWENQAGRVYTAEFDERGNKLSHKYNDSRRAMFVVVTK